jgi:predicted  nucleic acid-binding Zn-ribbon protein
MSDELQAEVDRLKKLNEKLAKDLVSAHDDLKEVRGEARDRRHENKSLAQQLADLTAERDDYKVKAEATPRTGRPRSTG